MTQGKFEQFNYMLETIKWRFQKQTQFLIYYLDQ